MRQVAALIAEVLERLGAGEAALEETIAKVRRQVADLTARFPLYRWKLSTVGA